jgi:hypothetical protein
MGVEISVVGRMIPCMVGVGCAMAVWKTDVRRVLAAPGVAVAFAGMLQAERIREPINRNDKTKKNLRIGMSIYP